MAAIEGPRPLRGWRLAARQAAGVFGSLLGSLLTLGHARAADLPEDRAEAMLHAFSGGGVHANGPALLVRKRLADTVSLSGSLNVDMVSNASVDVVTSASPYRERRNEYALGVDYAVRDTLITLGTTRSREPDYQADATSLDIAQEVFGGMTTVSLGYTRGADKVGQHGTPGFLDKARHWRWRLGATQVLSPRWLMSANFEAVADEGYLGSPYRVARVFGAAVPERNPRTRSSRALQLRASGDLGSRDALHLQYRYFWDTWGIRAHTAELGYSRHFGDAWLADVMLRSTRQQRALFYSDNASTETLYLSRNRQLGSFTGLGLGGRVAWTARRVGEGELKLNAGYERLRYRYSDFTDLRTGQPYAFDANVLQLFATLTY